MSRLLPCLLLLIGLSSGALDARATTFTVTRTDDPSPDDCLPGDCSLREAALAANADDPAAGTDRIQLAAASYTLVRGALTCTQDLELVGSGSAATHVTTDVELFANQHDHTLSIRGLSMRASTALARALPSVVTSDSGCELPCARRRCGNWPTSSSYNIRPSA